MPLQLSPRPNPTSKRSSPSPARTVGSSPGPSSASSPSTPWCALAKGQECDRVDAAVWQPTRCVRLGLGKLGIMSETEHTTRVFQAGSFAFIVESNQRRLCETVERLFADLSTGNEPATRLTLTNEPDGTRLAGADLVSFTYRRDTSAVLDELVTAVNRLMLNAGSGRLHLHAGAVSRGDRTVLLSAASGTGKTTLVTTLARRGWTYLTDEAISLAGADRRVRSFPKPLSIKPGGHNLFPDLVGHRVSLGGAESGLWQVPVGALGITTAMTANPTMIVVLSRKHGGEQATWGSISAANAVVALVEQSLDFERYGESALFAIAELCVRCRCVQIDAGTPSDTAELVEDLACSDPKAGTTAHVATMPVQDRTSRVAPEVTAVAIGEDAVLRHATTGRVLSLNAAGTELWAGLSNGAMPEKFRGIEVEAFISQLVDNGFIR